MTTTTPAIDWVSAIARSSSVSAAYWIDSSRVRTTVEPSVEGRSVWPTGRRRASVWTKTFAARPLIWSSKAYSTPLIPVLSRPTYPRTCEASSRFG